MLKTKENLPFKNDKDNILASLNYLTLEAKKISANDDLHVILTVALKMANKSFPNGKLSFSNIQEESDTIKAAYIITKFLYFTENEKIETIKRLELLEEYFQEFSED